mgnify:CR=1 FL=1
MTKEIRKLTKEEFENIDWRKSKFTRAEIEEMDKRAANIKNAIPWNKAWEKIKMEEELEAIELAKAGFTRAEIREIDKRANNIGKVQSFTSDEILKEILSFD